MIQEQKSLREYNTFGLNVKADYFANINSITDLQTILKDPKWQTLPKLILGGGSNILLLKNYSGLVLHMNIHGIKIIQEDTQHIWLKVGAGEIWHDFVNYCLEHNYGGIENLSLIPGTVGAAPMQNIGAYGVELESVFDSLEAVNSKDGSLHTFQNQECEFGYRSSVFKTRLKNQFIICSVTMKLNKQPELSMNYGRIRKTLEDAGTESPSIKDISDAVIKIRQSKLPDPKIIGNAGSFFKNPCLSDDAFAEILKDFPDIPRYPGEDGGTKIPAAWLIEKAGWRGKQQGHVGTYKDHALVIVNHGNATGEEVFAFAKQIQADVKTKFNIDLTPEVNIIDSQ